MPSNGSSGYAANITVYIGYENGDYVIRDESGATITTIERLGGLFGEALSWRFWNTTNDPIDIAIINFNDPQQPGKCPVLLPGCSARVEDLAPGTLSPPETTLIVPSDAGVSSGTWTYEIHVSKGDGTNPNKLDPELQIDNAFVPPLTLTPVLLLAALLAAIGWWWWRRRPANG